MTSQVGIGGGTPASYETVAAGVTDQMLGGAGAVDDYLERLIIVPGVAAAGIVQIQDGAGTAFTVFVGGGTTALPNLMPVTVELGIRSVLGGWSITTGANVTVLAVGNFTR